MKKTSVCALGFTGLLALSTITASAWDYEGHRAVNQLALYSLPTNFPAFAKTPEAQARVAYLAGEPDRWRNTPDVSLKHYSFPDHYLDIEEMAVYGLKPDMLSPFRYDFVAQLALARQAHPEKFPPAPADKNEDHTRELVGFLPWAIVENYAKLKSGFSNLKAFEEAGGTPEEIANAQANIIYTMGVMGHYVGDAGQPLHSTIHHHGWVGANPNAYSTNSRIHSWIDGGYFNKIGGANLKEMETKIHTAEIVPINGHPAKPTEMFQASVLFILDANKLVEPLYQREKDGRLSGNGEKGLEGRAFLEGQLIKSGQFLGDLWYSAWQQAPPDNYLKQQLEKRKSAGTDNAEKK